MKQDQIKKECAMMYKQIKAAEDHLKTLRSLCTHENKSKGNYSYRVGAIYPAIICKDCGELIQTL